MLSTDNDYYDGYIGMNNPKMFFDGSQIHSDIDERDAIWGICERIKETKNEFKVIELSSKIMGKV